MDIIITQPDGLLTLRLGLMIVDLRVQPATSYYQIGDRTATRATPAHHAVLVNVCTPWTDYPPHHARLNEIADWLTALGVDIRPLNDEAARQGWPTEPPPPEHTDAVDLALNVCAALQRQGFVAEFTAEKSRNSAQARLLVSHGAITLTCIVYKVYGTETPETVTVYAYTKAIGGQVPGQNQPAIAHWPRAVWRDADHLTRLITTLLHTLAGG